MFLALYFLRSQVGFASAHKDWIPLLLWQLQCQVQRNQIHRLAAQRMAEVGGGGRLGSVIQPGSEEKSVPSGVALTNNILRT